MERIKAETRRVEINAQSSESAHSITDVGREGKRRSSDRFVRFKMVEFDEKTTDAEAFCRMFEVTAKAYKLPAEYWGIEFAKCLKGRAQEVYQRMSDEECCTYEALKDALRKRYRLTEGGFRSRFRKAKCQEKEPLKDFRYRLERYFDNWVKMSEVGQTYEEVKSLMVKDQLFFTLPQEVQMHVKEKGKQKLDEVVRNATN